MGVLVGMTFAVIALVILLAILADEVVRLRAQVDEAKDVVHSACIAHIADVTSKRFGAVIIRDLARRYESGDEVRVLNQIKREQWSPEGKVLPVLWLEHHANLLDPDINEVDRTSFPFMEERK